MTETMKQGCCDGVPQELVPLLEWSLKQGAERVLEVYWHVTTITQVLEGQRRVTGPWGTFLDVLSLKRALLGLRDLATGAGFPGAAAYCQQTYEEAQQLEGQIIGREVQALACEVLAEDGLSS